MEEQYKDIEKLVKEAGIEEPSVNFLQNVMNTIEVPIIDKPFVYQPLISKKAWLIISLLIAGILVSLPFLPDATSILGTLDLSFMSIQDVKNPLSDFKLHTTTMYGIVFLAILFLVQITIIKKRIDRIFSL